jgi:DNA-binding protein H-NS
MQALNSGTILGFMTTTYETIMSKVRELTRKAEQAKRAEQRRLSRGVERVKRLMKQHGISIAHLGGSSAAGGSTPKNAGKSTLSPNDGRLKVKPKYRHPKSKETWSGRGKTPRWLAAEIKSGKRKDDFLIKSR